MQSAFVDIGLERDGFLYVSDVVNEEFEKLDPDEDAEEKKAEKADIDRSRFRTVIQIS